MPFCIDIKRLKLEREKRCLAFCSVLREAHLVSSDLSSLLSKIAPPASQSSIAAVMGVQASIKAISIPPECAKLVCNFAFGGTTDHADSLLRKCISEQMCQYSRLPGKLVFYNKALAGERVRESKYPWIGYGKYFGWRSRGVRRFGTIARTDCDHGTEVAVAWDDGTVSGDALGGLKCGKKGVYRLVYD